MTTIKNRFLDLLERAGVSAGQAFLMIMFGSALAESATRAPWYGAVTAAVIAALVSVLLSIAQFAISKPLAFWPDLLVRAVKTFVATWAGLLGAAPIVDLLDVPWQNQLWISLGAAGSAILKGMIAANLPGTVPDSPSLVSGTVGEDVRPADPDNPV